MDGKSASVVISAGFQWQVHPFARNRPRGILALGIIVFTAALLAWKTGGVTAGVLAALVLGVSTHTFFLVTSYEIMADGVQVTRLGQKVLWRWDAYRAVERRDSNLRLLRHGAGSRLAWLRAVQVDLPECANEVHEYVRERIETRR